MKKVDNSNAVAPGDRAEDAAAGAATVEITATELQKEQRKSLDALYAAAREEFDLDMSPVDSALKTLRDGREIQKLSVVRNLVELVEGEPEDALHRLLPMIQELLSVEPSNLDMHCEAAVAYKNCIKKKKLQQKCPELSDRFLAAILDNIETQKENGELKTTMIFALIIHSKLQLFLDTCFDSFTSSVDPSNYQALTRSLLLWIEHLDFQGTSEALLNQLYKH
uniref:Fes1 domain-containing protein n=1 Tax=Globodera pallida TaxID=36090 RepID=A0A183BW58_GLOPA